MAVASHPENFFQTTSSIAEIERKKRKATNSQGNPIKLPSKVLAVESNDLHNQTGDSVFVVEAGGLLSSITLSTGEVSRIGTPSQAPLTSITHARIPESNLAPAQIAVFSGGWDKTINKLTFDVATAATKPTLKEQISFKGHTDFIKCLAIARTADQNPTLVLISGGADGELVIWDMQLNTRLATIKPQARSIECITPDPFSNPATSVIYFSTSQREIFSINIPSYNQITSQSVQSSLSAPLIVHETSVYKLVFDNAGDMWTASADKSSKRLTRDEAWQADLMLQHPDFVRDIVPSAHNPYVATACRDENVRIWDTRTGELLHVFVGHFEEVTGLAMAGHTLVSVSIDATVRRWSLRPDDLNAEIERAKHPNLIEDEPEVKMDDFGLTEEEEAELRAMMEDEEEQSLEKMAMDTQ